jgi:short-subunit dehydrogenase
VVAATRGLEVGFVVFNAGAVNHGTSFVDLPVDDWLAIVRRNNEVAVRLCHHFGSALRGRGHGGLVLMSSGAGAAGAGRLAIYSATKAFDRNFGEALWAELSPQGVDVLSVVVPPTKTPALLRLLDKAGVPPPDVFAEPDHIVATVLEHLGDGPTLVFEQPGKALDEAAGAERRALVVGNTQGASGFFGQEGS